MVSFGVFITFIGPSKTCCVRTVMSDGENAKNVGLEALDTCTGLQIRVLRRRASEAVLGLSDCFRSFGVLSDCLFGVLPNRFLLFGVLCERFSLGRFST